MFSERYPRIFLGVGQTRFRVGGGGDMGILGHFSGVFLAKIKFFLES